MKFNKKLVVTSLSTVLGLGIVGSISGTFAWYQYSTKATASVFGTSTGHSGILEISKTAENGSWKTDLFTDDLKGTFNPNSFEPVTFGGSAKNAALNAKAYVNPNVVGKGAYSNWREATKNVEYLQYDVYLQARQFDASDNTYKRVALPVYLSDITLKDASTNPVGKSITEALRVHIAVDEVPISGDPVRKANFLISANDMPTVGEDKKLATFGNLDLDGDQLADKEVVDYVQTENKCVYGEENTYQTTYKASDLQATREGNGFADGSTVIATTYAESSTNKLRLTVTIWLEGWAQTDSAIDTTVKAMWDPAKRIGAKFVSGLTFDVGAAAFDN